MTTGTEGRPVNAGEYVDGQQVYNWPEFKAFCARLGIAWELPTTCVTIRVPCEGLPTIIQEYHGKDLKDELAKERGTETTTAHNQKWRTFCADRPTIVGGSD